MSEFTNQVESLTSAIKAARSRYYISKVTDYACNVTKIEQLKKELWALDNGYTSNRPVFHVELLAFNAVFYQWAVTLIMIMVGDVK